MDWILLLCLVFVHILGSHGEIDVDRIVLRAFRKYIDKNEATLGAGNHKQVYAKPKSHPYPGYTQRPVAQKYKFPDDANDLPEPKYEHKRPLWNYRRTKWSRKFSGLPDLGYENNRPMSSFFAETKPHFRQDAQNYRYSYNGRRDRTVDIFQTIKDFIQNNLHVNVKVSRTDPEEKGRRYLIEHLPPTEDEVPGNTLIQPTNDMLQSASKYPHQSKLEYLVYGNPKFIGDKSSSSFRKANRHNLLNRLLQIVAKADHESRLNPNIRRSSFDSLPLPDQENPKDAYDQSPRGELKIAKYPPDANYRHMVYGGPQNVGKRSLSNFRRRNNLVNQILKILANLNKDNENSVHKSAHHHSFKHAHNEDISEISEESEENSHFNFQRRSLFDTLPLPDQENPRDAYDQSPRGELKIAKYPPEANYTHMVYGSPQHVGKRPLSSFRRANNLVNRLLKILSNVNRNNRNSVHRSAHHHSFNHAHNEDISEDSEQFSEEENNASEIDDRNLVNPFDYRHFHKVLHPTRKQSGGNGSTINNNTIIITQNCSEEDSSATDGDSSDEKNDGNPYTIFKNKYRQNWHWDFELGDHMNINGYAPEFKNQVPSGPSLFFGRKWWYFNQDDYKPFR